MGKRGGGASGGPRTRTSRAGRLPAEVGDLKTTRFGHISLATPGRVHSQVMEEVQSNSVSLCSGSRSLTLLRIERVFS